MQCFFQIFSGGNLDTSTMVLSGSWFPSDLYLVFVQGKSLFSQGTCKFYIELCRYGGIMYSQFGVVPLLYLRYTSVVHLVYLCCTSYFPLLFPSCAPVLPLMFLLYLSCSFEVPLLFLCLAPEDIEMISRCQMQVHSGPFFVPLGPSERHCLQ